MITAQALQNPYHACRLNNARHALSTLCHLSTASGVRKCVIGAMIGLSRGRWPRQMTPARLLLPGERCTHRLTSSYGTRLGASVESPYILPSSCPHPASGPWDWINAGHSLSTAHRNKQTGIRFLVSTLVPNSLEPGMILFPNPACSHPDPRHPKHWQSAAKYPLPCRCPSLIRQVIDCR